MKVFIYIFLLISSFAYAQVVGTGGGQPGPNDLSSGKEINKICEAEALKLMNTYRLLVNKKTRKKINTSDTLHLSHFFKTLNINYSNYLKEYLSLDGRERKICGEIKEKSPEKEINKYTNLRKQFEEYLFTKDKYNCKWLDFTKEEIESYKKSLLLVEKLNEK